MTLSPLVTDTLPGRPYRLRYLGDPILTTVCPLVTDERPWDLSYLINEMRRIRNADRGLGISANQVGVLLRVFVARLGAEDLVCINPSLSYGGEHVLCAGEGCLSIPGFRTSTRRWTKVALTFEDEQRVQQRRNLTDLAAQVAQHEMDHLLGKLITDGVSRQQRRDAERLVAKARERV